MPHASRRERKMRAADGQQVHPFRLHEGESARNARTDEVFDWTAGTAAVERSLRLVIHDQDVVALVKHQHQELVQSLPRRSAQREGGGRLPLRIG